MSSVAEVGSDQRLAYVFPGQGSQYIGMGRELFEGYEVARATFRRAEEVLGQPVMRWCFEGPEKLLNDTRYTQPAVFTTNIAAMRVLQAAGEQPDIVAGHSLGEYSALVAAEAISFEDGLLLVQQRAEYMAEAGEKSPGAMAAVSNLALDSLKSLLAAGAYIANQNTPAQNVISGTREAISGTIDTIKEHGLRAIIHRLPISIPAHSPLMSEAAERMKVALSSAKIRKPSIPVLSNATAEPFVDEKAIRESLPAQLTSGVLWWPTIEKMLAMGVEEIKEVGPKQVLTRMIGRALSGSAVKVTPTDDP